MGTALGLQACGPAQTPAVIAADGVLCDITKRLAGSDLQVGCLLQPGDDPHQFRLTPQQSRELGQARLILINGYGLTPAMAKQANAIAVAELAVPNSPVLVGKPEELAGKPEESEGHAQHPSDRDPHVWHDPNQASAMVRLVAQQLEQLNPGARNRIMARANAMEAVLQDLDRWNRQQLATIPVAKPLATGHRAYASLARAYGLRELPVVDATSSSQSLRPQAFQAVIHQLKSEQIPVLFAEQLPASQALQRISSLSGVPLAPAPLVADGLAKARVNSGSSDLVATLTANTCLIVTGLQGSCNKASQRNLIRQWEAIR
jgi:zinc/manganese transport system substrate-binding protein